MGKRKKPVKAGPKFDSIYFNAKKPWPLRKRSWLEREIRRRGDVFTGADAAAVEKILSVPETRPRMVVNISGEALLEFIKAGRYLNAYQRPVLMGKERGVSKIRQRVDTLLGYKRPQDIYFGAVALGGCGVRFYGEYCLVLKDPAGPNQLRLFERNPYNLVVEPLRRRAQNPAFVKGLFGDWTNDLTSILVLKVLPQLPVDNRLVTAGTVADGVLQDEDFVEVHRTGSFGVADIDEVRVPAQAVTQALDIRARCAEPEAVSATEMLWLAQHDRSLRQIRQAGIACRVVGSSARTGRWG